MDFQKKRLNKKIQLFSILGGKKTFVENPRLSFERNIYFTSFGAFYFHFASSLFLVIFQTVINFRPKIAWPWFSSICIIQSVFKNIFKSLWWWRKIDVWKGMSSLASISVMLRTLLKKRGGRKRSPRRSRVKINHMSGQGQVKGKAVFRFRALGPVRRAAKSKLVQGAFLCLEKIMHEYDGHT